MADKDLSFPTNGYIPPAIPDGDQYQVVFTKAETKSQWGQQKIFLWFKMITPGNWISESFYMVCTVPPNCRWTPSCKYWRVWVLANGTRPNRRDRMSTAVFRHKIFRVRLRTVRKNAKQIALSPAQQYSVVDELLDVQTGQKGGMLR
jgi:hypothetical protein